MRGSGSAKRSAVTSCVRRARSSSAGLLGLCVVAPAGVLLAAQLGSLLLIQEHALDLCPGSPGAGRDVDGAKTRGAGSGGDGPPAASRRALTWDAVDLDGSSLFAQSQIQRIAGRLVHGETKTEASTAPLPLPGICVSALRLRAADQERAKKAAGNDWLERGYVFTTNLGNAIDPRNVNHSFKRRCRLAGVREVRVRDTRHTCGTLLAGLDVHPRVAMQILRHSKIAVTMEIYTHAPTARTVEALRQLGEYLGDQSADENEDQT